MNKINYIKYYNILGIKRTATKEEIKKEKEKNKQNTKKTKNPTKDKPSDVYMSRFVLASIVTLMVNGEMKC